MNLLKKLAAAVEEFGLAQACVYVMDRGLNRLGGSVRLYRIVAQPVPAQPLLTHARGQTIAVRRVSSDDPSLKHMPLDRRVIDYRVGQDAVCLGAFKGAQMIGCLWFCLGPYREDEVRCRFIPIPLGKASWDFDVYLLPEHRVGIGFARLWDEANRLLRERGIAWSMSRISALNRRSLAAHARLGARVLGTTFFLRIGRMQLAFASLHPKVHLSFGSQRIPQFVIRAPDESIGSLGVGAKPILC